ncbi:MAG TPA: class II aldolase/adducin family protein [Allosphingosinicella sp.]|nr:class II aldolase/adducin family protein [Allosphingosinicella sp.]
MSKDENEARVELAACYRLIAHFGLTDTIYNHISLRLPGDEERFLINAFGLIYDEITASNLVTIDLDGNIIDDPTGLGINPAGFVIHAAIHDARHDVKCVLHTHSPAGMGVAAQKHGLLPISQHAAFLMHDIAYHDSEGPAIDLDERARIVADLGDKHLLILRNHGLLTAGRSVAEALQLMIDLETACRGQIAAMAGGAELTYLTDAALDRSAKAVANRHNMLGRDWAALVRLADRVAPGYRN